MNAHESLNVGFRFADDEAVMRRAVQIARRGIGFVEPNPAVGAVVVDNNLQLISEGYHQKFGDAHAEVNAIKAAGERTARHQLFVTLEPCSHHGKTPPCADAVIAAGFRRVVIGCKDPAPHVSGAGISKLQEADISVDVGICGDESGQLIAPFRKLQKERRPWVHAKWAMTLDGRIATRTGHSKWISSEESRTEVHRLRGCMDVIITGAGTVRADNPTLTARPAGPRTPVRVVVDSDGKCVRPDGNLMQSLSEAPVLLCVRADRMDEEHCNSLQNQGAELLITSGNQISQVEQLLDELGKRHFTNVLLEAGSGLMGTFFDDQLVDEVHVFVAPKIVGGSSAISPVGGTGQQNIPNLASLTTTRSRNLGSDILIEGRIQLPPEQTTA